MAPGKRFLRTIFRCGVLSLFIGLTGCGGCNLFRNSGTGGVTVGTISILPPPTRPRVEMNGEGDAMAVWNVEKTLHARQYSAGAWGPETSAYTGVANIDEVTVAMWGVNATAAWEEDDAVFSLDFDFLAGWSGAPVSHGSALDPRRGPRLATNTFGSSSTVYLAWRGIFTPEPLTTHAGAVANRRLPGAGWQLAKRVDTNDIQIVRPQNVFGLNVGMDGFGRGFAVWTQTDDSSGAFLPSVVAARWNGTWEKAEVLDTATSAAGTPHVGADADGDTLLVYTIDGDTFARRWVDALGAWDAPAVLGPEPGKALSPRVAVNGDGVGVAVWWNDGGGIWSNRFDPTTGTWSVHQRIDIDPTGAMSSGARDPRVGIDRDGNARVVWEAGDGVHTVSLDRSRGSWDPSERLGAGTAPDVAMDASGVAVAVWWDEGLEERVWTPVPKGSGEIVFASYRGAGDFNIYVMNPDGLNVRPLTNDVSDDLDPSWSPDRSEVAFLSDRDSPFGTEDLYVLDIASRGVRRLTSVGADAGKLADPAWSPDGSTIAVAGNGGGFFGIVLVDAITGVQTYLTTSLGDRWPSWSPDGTQIAFVRAGDLHLLDPAGAFGQTPTLLLDSDDTDEHAAWSPDGTKIAFARRGPAEFGIWVIEVATGTVTQITDVFDDDHPDWSPDGQSITFMRIATEGPRVFMVPSTGGTATEVPGQLAGNDHPDWK